MRSSVVHSVREACETAGTEREKKVKKKNKPQAVYLADLVKQQQRKRAIRTAIIGVPIYVAFAAIVSYAVVGLMTP